MEPSASESVVITGIGLVAANGFGREAVWRATRQGISGIRRLTEADYQHLPSCLNLAAPVDIDLEFPEQLKAIRLARWAAEEAIFDALIDFDAVDRNRFACAVSGHMGDIRFRYEQLKQASSPQAERLGQQSYGLGSYGTLSNHQQHTNEQWLPNSACWNIANRYSLNGPRYSHSTACASGLVEILTAARAIQDGQCDIALVGSSEAIDPLFAAGFAKMGVLANGTDFETSCLPFDARRHGFVMGEGAGMFVIERLSHALARGARIYAEFVAGKMLADAHHVTSLDIESGTLVRLIEETLHRADVDAADVGYINAHGTGTLQNDVLEARGIRKAFGSAADEVCVSSLKSMLGHLVAASGSVELALTVLGMRDGIAPPTLNLLELDPDCDLDFIPMIQRKNRFQHALKLSLAFGGHLVAALVRRWNEPLSGFAYPSADAARRAA